MQGHVSSLDRMEAFIDKHEKLAEADGDRRRSRANSYNATAAILLEHGYFDADEMPSDGRSPQLSEAVDTRIARLNTADILDAMERIEANTAAATKAALKTEKLAYLIASPLIVAIVFVLLKLS